MRLWHIHTVVLLLVLVFLLLGAGYKYSYLVSTLHQAVTEQTTEEQEQMELNNQVYCSGVLSLNTILCMLCYGFLLFVFVYTYYVVLVR